MRISYINDRSKYWHFAFNWGGMWFLFALAWPSPWHVIWYKKKIPNIEKIKYEKRI